MKSRNRYPSTKRSQSARCGSHRRWSFFPTKWSREFEDYCDCQACTQYSEHNGYLSFYRRHRPIDLAFPLLCQLPLILLHRRRQVPLEFVNYVELDAVQISVRPDYRTPEQGNGNPSQGNRQHPEILADPPAD